MEKRKTFHGRQVGKKRLLPIVFPLFLFLLIPLNGYGDDTPMPEVVQQNSTRITGVVKDAYGEPVIGANVKVVGTTQGTITDFEGKFSINVSGASAKIKISFIGYKDKEVTAKKGVSLNRELLGGDSCCITFCGECRAGSGYGRCGEKTFGGRS